MIWDMEEEILGRASRRNAIGDASRFAARGRTTDRVNITGQKTAASRELHTVVNYFVSHCYIRDAPSVHSHEQH